jgi:hypothetical protein
MLVDPLNEYTIRIRRGRKRNIMVITKISREKEKAFLTARFAWRDASLVLPGLKEVMTRRTTPFLKFIQLPP